MLVLLNFTHNISLKIITIEIHRDWWEFLFFIDLVGDDLGDPMKRMLKRGPQWMQPLPSQLPTVLQPSASPSSLLPASTSYTVIFAFIPQFNAQLHQSYNRIIFKCKCINYVSQISCRISSFKKHSNLQTWLDDTLCNSSILPPPCTVGGSNTTFKENL